MPMSFSVILSRSTGTTGFLKKPFAPDLIASSKCNSSPTEVRITTLASGFTDKIARIHSSPFISSIIISQNTRSGLSCLYFSRPSLPFGASPQIVYPAFSSISRSRLRASIESSINSIFAIQFLRIYF